MICPNPQCKSSNTYFDGVENICIDCRKRWLRDGESRAELLKTEGNIPKVIPRETIIKTEGREKAMAKGICRNCGRGGLSIVKDHLCGGCNNSVKGLEKGTPEYYATLAAAKDRFTNPDAPALKRGPKKSAKQPSNIPENIHPTETKKGKPSIGKSQIVGPRKKEKDVLTILEDRRHKLMDEIMVINQTIEVIKKYSQAA